MRFRIVALMALVLGFGLFLAGCSEKGSQSPQSVNTSIQQPPGSYPSVSRNSAIPANATKMTPEMDVYPPVLHSNEWNAPVPLGPPIDTAGAEDSPFVTPDGNTLYFFFTPDVNVPLEKQLLDNLTGIWVSRKSGGKWSEPQRVWLDDPGKLSLDGCEFVQNDTIWFCAAREGYTGLHWFTARQVGGKWQDWNISDFPASYGVGEMHITADGRQLYFGSARAGGKGAMDIWVSENEDGTWQEPQNVAIVNTVDNEGWPFVSQDGKELWFLRTYQGSPALFRSMKANDSWQEPELIVSSFAGEPTLDNAGNLYFVHHFYNNSKMIEADIYVAYRK